MKIQKIKEGMSPSEVSRLLEATKRHTIEKVNWHEYPYAPKVSFAVLHDGDAVYIKYFVCEKNSLAKTTEDQGPVWTDSCCEFFVSFDDTGYYNFEFNCIGTALLAFRKIKQDTTSADKAVMALIERYPSLPREPFDEKCVGEWSLMVKIPKEAFFKHTMTTLSRVTATANFYKCGDDLSDLHFLSWNPIKAEKPNFHLPAFFGKIEFE